MYMHKLHKIPDDLTLTSQCEARYIIELSNPLVEDKPTGLEVKKIFKEKFHSTWDIFFSGDVIMDQIGLKEFTVSMICRHNRLPKGFPDKFFHKQKMTSCAMTKVARCIQPIITIK